MNAIRCSAGLAGILVAGLATAGGRISIVSEDSASRAWTHAPGVAMVVPGYPEAAPDRTRDVCVNIGFLIDAKGTTSNFTEMKSWSSATGDETPAPELVRPYVQIAAFAISQWRFVPAAGEKPQQIFTSATIAFDGSKSLGEQAIRARCHISNLPAFVAKEASREKRRGGLNEQRESARRQNERMAQGQ